jgi:hypothetical protein
VCACGTTVRGNEFGMAVYGGPGGILGLTLNPIPKAGCVGAGGLLGCSGRSRSWSCLALASYQVRVHMSSFYLQGSLDSESGACRETYVLSIRPCRCPSARLYRCPTLAVASIQPVTASQTHYLVACLPASVSPASMLLTNASDNRASRHADPTHVHNITYAHTRAQQHIRTHVHEDTCTHRHTHTHTHTCATYVRLHLHLL